MGSAERLYEAFMETAPKGCISGDVKSNFPHLYEISDCASADTLAEFSRLMKPGDFKEKYKDFNYNYLVSDLMNKAIENGDRRFEFESHGLDTFPHGVYADKVDARVQLVLNGDLGYQGVRSCHNLDVLIRGNAGDHLGIFGENNRIYVAGHVGAFPMDQSENCVLDAQSIGPNQLMVEDGTLISRDDARGNFYDGKKWKELLDEGAPLIGPTNFLVKNKLVVLMGMKKSNTTFLTAGKAKRPYKHIDYERPSWVPSRI